MTPKAITRREAWQHAAWYGWALALTSTLASSIVTPLSRGIIVAGLDPILLLLLRLSIAVTLMGITIALVHPEHFRIERRGFWRIMGVGLLAGLEICCFFSALAYVDASMSAMIKSTQPLVVLLLLTLGGERLTRRQLIRLALAICGIYLLVGPGGTVAPLGLVFLLLSLLLYGSQLVFIQWWLSSYNPHTVALYLSAVMTTVIAGWWWWQGAHWHDPGTAGWTVILVLAIVSTWFARLALFGAIARIGSGQIALLWPLQTLLIIILSVLFLGERMSTIQWVGGVLILSSTALAARRGSR
ncbi:MAG TPA: DMT family transporter [Caldilineaceae bacterium]|nr:DMT family transporter [Caldilineaceae bacterium]